MKKFLDKQISVRTVLIITLVVVFVITAAASTVTTIQAVLASYITIKYDGEVQTLRDANGDIVYPLSYRNTTYLPVRAISGILDLPIEWDEETSTILLGNTSKSLFDVATMSGNHWHRHTDAVDFPIQTDESGNELPNEFTFAYRATEIRTGNRTATLTLTNPQNYISFTLARGDTENKTVTFRLINLNTNTIIYETTILSGQFIEVIDLDISGITKLSINALASTGGGPCTLFILNPTVK